MVDEDFLARKFGDIKYHAIRSEVHPQGVIITDYIADAILKQNNNYKDKDYRYLVQYGLTLAGWNYDAIMINGIIDTGYKDQYRALFERVIKDGLSTGEDLYNDTELQSFINDVYDRLGYCYTTNQNFYEDYINAENWRYPIYHKLVFNNALEYLNVYSNYIYKIEDNGDKIIESLSGWRYTDTPPEIPEGAKYIRVAYPPALETYLKKTFVDRDPESFLGYARLRFDDGELISEELMNFESSLILKASGEGIFYNNKSCMVSDYIPIPEGAVITEFSSFTPRNYAYCAFYDEDKNVISTNIATDPAISGEKTIVMPYKMYNDIFGTDFSSNNVEEFVPHTVNMAHYMRYDVEKENPLFKETVYIAGLTDSNIFLSEDLFTLFYKDSIMVNGLYLDGTDNIGGALNVAERLNMEHQSFAIEGIRSMTRAVEVFVPIFEFIAIFLYVGVIFILVNFSSKMINDKMHEIGILKALGTKNKSIGVVFGLQLVFIAILTCALSTLGYYMFIDVANDILVDSVKSIAPTWTVLDLQFLTYQPDIAKENCILIFALAFISLVFPMIKIKAIKPVKIIKAKE